MVCQPSPPAVKHRVYKHHPTEVKIATHNWAIATSRYAYLLLYFVFVINFIYSLLKILQTSSLSSCDLTVARSFMVQTRSRLRKEMETKATTAAEALRPTKIPLQPLMQQPEPITIVRERKRPTVPKFKNRDDELSIKQWIHFYEIFSEGETDRLRINGIVSHFEGEPLKWFANEATSGRLDDMDWPEVKQVIMTRFTSDTKTDLGRALEIRFSTKENINEYYYKKMSFLDSTNLSDAEKIDCLTIGLPEKPAWEINKVRHTIHSLQDWLNVASSVWSVMNDSQTRVRGPTFTGGDRSIRATTMVADRPSVPCRYCISRGKPKEYHWHNKCMFNPNIRQQKRPSAHFIEQDVQLEENLEEVALN